MKIADHIKIILIKIKNPDLPYSFIKDILKAREDKLAGTEKPFKFRTR